MSKSSSLLLEDKRCEAGSEENNWQVSLLLIFPIVFGEKHNSPHIMESDELYSGFQRREFSIPQGKISQIPDSISKNFLGVGGVRQQNSEDTRRPRKVLCHILPVHTKK